MTKWTEYDESLRQRHPDAAVVVPSRADAVLSATAQTDPTQRDRHIQMIAEKGRLGWLRASTTRKPGSREDWPLQAK